MPQFAYRARSLDGTCTNGLLNAASKRDALAALSQRSLFPVEVSDSEKSSIAFGLPLLQSNRVKSDQLANALTQLADLLQNGVPLLASLDLLADQSTNVTLQQVMGKIRDDVAEGLTLNEAMARHPETFSDLTLNMVRAGSEGAFLEDALKRVAQFLELQQELKGRVTAAMAYPAFLAIGGSIVTMVLVVFFVPRFESLFERLQRQGTGLPVATHILLGVSDFLISYGVYLAIAVSLGLFGLRNVLRTESAITLMDHWKLKLPLVGKIFHDLAISRFTRVLGTLLRNGVPILKALTISGASTGNRLLASAIKKSAENISSGEALSGPLSESGLIPPSTMAMIRVAEESNNLDNVLINVADNLEKKIDRQLSLMVRMLEPIMLVIIGGAVLFILVALLLPVFDMSSAVS